MCRGLCLRCLCRWVSICIHACAVVHQTGLAVFKLKLQLLLVHAGPTFISHLLLVELVKPFFQVKKISAPSRSCCSGVYTSAPGTTVVPFQARIMLNPV